MQVEQEKYYTELFRSFPEQTLINRLGEGKDAYRDGVYELLIQEATDRGLSGSSLDERIQISKTECLNRQINAWIVWGYILPNILRIYFGGKLLEAAKLSEDKIKTKAHTHGVVLTILGSLLPAIAVIAFIASVVIRIVRNL